MSLVIFHFTELKFEEISLFLVPMGSLVAAHGRLMGLISSVLGLLAGSAFLSGNGGLDSGGGITRTPQYHNLGSVGSIGSVGTAGIYVVRTGLLEILFSPVALNPGADSDGNGLPDGWEREHFKRIGVDPIDDADKDGTSNHMEWLAGTDPINPASVFRPVALRDGNELLLTVPTHAERDYRIWGSADLGEWELLDSVSGDGTEKAWSYPLDGSESLPYFLQVEIVMR